MWGPALFGLIRPPSFANLIYWIDGYDLDGHRNSTLTSGASISTVVNKGSRGGTFTAPGTAPHCLLASSVGSIVFSNPSGSDRLVSPSGATLSAPLTIAMVVKQTVHSVNTFWLDGLSSSHRLNFSQNSTDWLTIAGDGAGLTETSPTVTPSSYNVIYAVLNGASSVVWMNGPLFPDQTGTTGTASATTATGISIGGAFNGTVGLTGEVVEMMVWSGVVSSLDAHAFIDQKYGGAGWPRTNISQYNYAPNWTPTLHIHGGDAISFFGNSITAGNGGAANRWQAPAETTINASVVTPCTFFNNGIPSNKVSDLIARVGTIIAESPQVVVVECSENDMFAHVDLFTFRGQVETLIGDLQAGLPGVKLAWLSMLCRFEYFPDPSVFQVNSYNDAIKDACAEGGVTYVDVRTPQQVYELANNTPAPGNTHSPGPGGQTLNTVDGIHPQVGLNGASLMSTAFISRCAFSG